MPNWLPISQQNPLNNFHISGAYLGQVRASEKIRKVPPTDPKNKLVLQNDLTIRQFDEILYQIRSNIIPNEILEIDCGDSPSFDVWFLQSIVSCHKTVEKVNGRVILSSRLRQALVEITARAGFPETFAG
jgi:hypothetical protein